MRAVFGGSGRRREGFAVRILANGRRRRWRSATRRGRLDKITGLRD